MIMTFDKYIKKRNHKRFSKFDIYVAAIEIL